MDNGNNLAVTPDNAMVITRKKRVDKPFRKTKYIDKILENNPNITSEEIAEFRKIHRQKVGNIRLFCKKHPGFDQRAMIDALPLSSIQELKDFKLLKWLKSQGVVVKTEESSDNSADEYTDSSE